MNKLFLALTAAITTLTPTAGLTTGNFQEHKRLYDTINSVGVRVVINNPKYCTGTIDGSYHSRERILSICQDNATWMNQEVDWTANDYDTLRHEAHHLVQDCVQGGLGDSQLGLLFGTMKDSREFVAEVYTPQQMRNLMGVDSYSGHNDYRQQIELEAFATAAIISPNDIADKITEICR